MGRGASEASDRTRTADRSDTEETPRQSEGRRTRSTSDDEDEEDDDDETSLRVPALGALAAVGLIGYAGGTVGIYGRGDTPIGLAAGYTQPTGGFQLHAAINGAVVDGSAGQKLTLKGLGFYDAFGARIQPAGGLGVQIDPQRDGDVQPAVSVGLVGNLGRIVLFGGVDVVQGTSEVGLSYNFRHGRGESEE